MGSLGDELSLGSMSIRNVSRIKNVAMEKDCELEDYVKMLEDEKRKIESSQLELPLCSDILNNAILYVKEEKKRCLEMESTQPLLKDFVSLNKPIQEEGGIDKREKLMKEKKFQKWKAHDHISNPRLSAANIKNKLEIERSEEKSLDDGLSMLSVPGMRTHKVETGLGLGLTSSAIVTGGRKGIASCGFASKCVPQSKPTPVLQQQGLRKQRRCWTPELHRRFVDALPQLGGPGVATPKQIREYMQEEGLTNDEVKSHLQKYRLHKRKLNSNQEKQSVVVLGFKLWNSSQEEDPKSDSPQGPLQLPCTTTTTTCGDSSMEDAKSESFQMERLISP